MILTLRVLSSAEGGDLSALVARFDAAGGLIGRADSARLKLPDPKRTVSRFHAHVSFADGHFFVEDMGSPNPIAVNNKVLQSGQRVELNAGDRIQIAHYLLGADIGDIKSALAEEQVNWDDGAEAEERTRLVIDRGAVAAGGGPPASAAELWAAFEEGARLQLELQQGLRPEMMRTIGAVLRGAVTALRKQLGLRMLVKRDSDTDLAAIRSKNNNPLKFALDDARAITALIKPPLPTFLAGPAAVDETASELEAHMRATMFAMRAASQQLLGRLDPALLERKLASGGMFDSLMPARRKAALWDAFVEQLREIAGGPGGFDETFNKVFLAAYDHEIARLRRPGTLAQPQPQPQSQAH
ncbi:MAG TPA: type VI secretion system-associated FHA domain protein [Burkholderiaceae bacterium]|nr:type VI secretion system-associated FHA domain protein [Burkholderiaceae bacterium]